MTEYCDIQWVHGWAGAPRVWASVVGELPRHRHIFPVFENVSAPADFLPQILRRIDSPTVLVGWSMGGMLAVHAAAVRPELVRGLVLFGTSLRFVNEDSDQGWPAHALRRMRQQLLSQPDETVQRFVHAMFSREDRRQGIDEKYREQVCGSDPLADCPFSETALAVGLEYLLEVDVREQFQRLSIPVLWIHGGNDPICPPGALARTRQELADRRRCQFRVWKGVGHVPFWSRPEASAAAVRRFLEATGDR